MRRSTTTSLVRLATLCATGALGLALAGEVAAEQHEGGTAKAMTAKIHPVAADMDRVDKKVTYGTAKFTDAGDKVDVLVQVAGLPLGGREASPASDGAPATVPFQVRVVKSGDCAKAAGASELVALPDLQVRDDGSGILMATTDKVKLADLAGQAVVIGAPGDKTHVGCGVISAD